VSTGERNYHIMYTLALGAPPAVRRRLRLRLPPRGAGVHRYRYLGGGDPETESEAASGLAGAPPAQWLDRWSAEWHELEASARGAGVHERERRAWYRLVGAVLHLGNVAPGPGLAELVTAAGGDGAIDRTADEEAEAGDWGLQPPPQLARPPPGSALAAGGGGESSMILCKACGERLAVAELEEHCCTDGEAGGGDAVEEEAASAEDFDDPSLASVRRSTAPHGGRPGLVGGERAISQPRSRLTNRPPH
jgi:hypothetical protein